MVFSVEATLQGYKKSWKTGPGGEILDIEIVLGQQENASTTTITLADPKGLTRNLLISHSLSTGGIPSLPKTSKTQGQNSPPLETTPSGPVTANAGGNGIVSSGAGFSPSIQAIADLISRYEANDPLALQGYYSLNGPGYFTPSTLPGFPAGVAHDQNIGRYQFNFGDMQDAINAKYNVVGFTPAEQDQILLYKLNFRHVLGPLSAGDLRGAILAAGLEWSSLPGSRIPQKSPGSEINPHYKNAPDGGFSDAIAYYNQRLAYYNGLAPSQTLPTKTDAPLASTKTDSSGKVTASTSGGGDLLPIQYGAGLIKGSLIDIYIAGFNYEFFHQETSANENGMTKVYGVGVRWVLTRRKRNASHNNTSLKKLATDIAVAHKVKLNYLSSFDPVFEHLDQTELSDYELLKRECDECGLFLSEDATNGITIKELRQVKDTSFVIKEGLNLLSFNIADKAMDASKEEPIDSLLQGENKVTIDPTTGLTKITKPDVDPIKGLSVTGKAKPQVVGRKTPDDTSKAQLMRARTKRVKGLPSSFKVYLTAETLAIAPLSVVRTQGFGEPLDRVWIVNKITHKLAEGTTTFDVFSPVEVIDNSPQVQDPITAQPTNTAAATTPVNGFICPCSGTVTTPYGEVRTYEVHNAIDIANNVGTPIVAAADGIVAIASYQGNGGNEIKIVHSNGWSTVYLHLSQYVAHQGQMVKQGETIGLMGSTGRSTGSHCHFAIKDSNGNPVNPADVGLKFFQRGATVTQGQK